MGVEDNGLTVGVTGTGNIGVGGVASTDGYGGSSREAKRS
jgi:hypothetical protein